MLISRASSFQNRQDLFWNKNIGIRRCRAWDTRKTVRQYQKEGMNDEGRRCTGKCSYTGHRVSEFEFFYITSKVIRQALLWKKNIGIRRFRASDTRKTVGQYQKEGRNNEARRCTGKCSYPGHGVWEFEFFHIKSKVMRQDLLWNKNNGFWRCRSWDTRKNERQYQKEGMYNEARRCTGKCSYPGHRVSEF